MSTLPTLDKTGELWFYVLLKNVMVRARARVARQNTQEIVTTSHRVQSPATSYLDRSGPTTFSFHHVPTGHSFEYTDIWLESSFFFVEDPRKNKNLPDKYLFVV